MPYPTDKDNILGQIDQSEKEAVGIRLICKQQPKYFYFRLSGESFLYFLVYIYTLSNRDGSVGPVSRYQEHFTKIS